MKTNSICLIETNDDGILSVHTFPRTRQGRATAKRAYVQIAKEQEVLQEPEGKLAERFDAEQIAEGWEEGRLWEGTDNADGWSLHIVTSSKAPKAAPIRVVVAVSGGMVQGARATVPLTLEVFDQDNLKEGGDGNQGWEGIKVEEDGYVSGDECDRYWEKVITKECPEPVY